MSRSGDVIVGDVIAENSTEPCNSSDDQLETAAAGQKSAMSLSTSDDDEAESCDEDDRVTINVSGLRFETRRSTLATHPTTLLGNARRRRQHYDPVRSEYFFERGRHTFDSLLYYYQSGGHLHRPMTVPLDVFVDDLRFYQLDEKTIEKCCASEGVFRQKLPQLPRNQFQRKVRRHYTFSQNFRPKTGL